MGGGRWAGVGWAGGGREPGGAQEGGREEGGRRAGGGKERTTQQATRSRRLDSPPPPCLPTPPTPPQVMEVYQPGAIVVCGGADSLSGDKLGCFNLSMQARCGCVWVFFFGGGGMCPGTSWAASTSPCRARASGVGVGVGGRGLSPARLRGARRGGDAASCACTFAACARSSHPRPTRETPPPPHAPCRATLRASSSSPSSTSP